MTTLETIGLEDGYAQLGDVRLHYVEAGDGPLVVLLHGFPEFWFGWRRQIPALAEAGFRVVAPDLRGYNLSSRPAGVAAYDTDLLAADVRDLIRERGADRAFLVGHDWGGGVAWATAIEPSGGRGAAGDTQLPPSAPDAAGPAATAPARQVLVHVLLPASAVAGAPRARTRLARPFAGPSTTPGPGRSRQQDIAHYVEAWSQPGAMTAMLNYYRASFRQRRQTRERSGAVQAPTLVIWGERDRYVGPELAEPDRADVPNLERVERLPDASHWVQHDEPERVGQLLIEFFGDGAEREPAA